MLPTLLLFRVLFMAQASEARAAQLRAENDKLRELQDSTTGGAGESVVELRRRITDLQRQLDEEQRSSSRYMSQKERQVDELQARLAQVRAAAGAERERRMASRAPAPIEALLPSAQGFRAIAVEEHCHEMKGRCCVCCSAC